MSGRVNMSTLIPQQLGEMDGTKGVSNLPFSVFEVCSGRTVCRDS